MEKTPKKADEKMRVENTAGLQDVEQRKARKPIENKERQKQYKAKIRKNGYRIITAAISPEAQNVLYSADYCHLSISKIVEMAIMNMGKNQ